MKLHPIHQFDKELRESVRTKDFLKSARKRLEGVEHGRGGWEDKLDHYRRRRYGQEFRNPSYPWPGSSSIVPPLVDKKIDELKPQYLNLITAVKPPVTVLASDKASQQRTASVELWLEWFIKFGSPRFVEECILMIDDLLETGRGILKSIWHYEVAPTPETLRPETLPPRLRQLIVTARSEKEADRMYAVMGQGTPILTRNEFDERRDMIEAVVAKEFDLDSEEPIDRKALSDIMRWFRAGANAPIQFEKRDIRCNLPGIVAVHPKDLIVPENTTDIESAECFSHRMWYSPMDVRNRVNHSGWDKDVVAEILKKRKDNRHSGSGQMSAMDDALREGISGTDDDRIEFHEQYVWFSPKPGEPEQKVIALVCAEMPDKPVKFYAYQRPSMLWPFHSATFELNKNRWYSPRGVPEKLDDLEYEIIQQHRAKLNRMTIANAPMFTYEMNSGVVPQNIRFIPGQMIPVRKQGGVQSVQIPNLDISFEREEQILRTWAEEYLGGTDFGLSNPLSSLNEARTATEINAIQGRARQSLSLRGTLFQRCMAGVYREMFDLFLQWGDQSVFVQVTGSEPVRLTREQLQGRYEFIPTGTIGEQDPQAEEQRAQQRVVLLTQAKQLGIVGDEYEIDLGQAVVDWLEKSDVRAARKLIRRRSPEEIQQIQQARQQAMEQQQKQEAALAIATGKPPQAGGGRPQQQKPMKMGV